MNLDELRSAQAKERRKDSLQHLRDSFYDDVGAYVADLRAARDRRAEQVENPFADDDVRRLSDEVETAEEVAEALYERRVGKVVKLASFAAADMSVDEDGMTTEERRLFDDLVERITANKSEVLDVLAGESPVSDGASPSGDAPVSADSPAPSDPTQSAPTQSDSEAGGSATGGPAPEVGESTADAAPTDPSARAADGDDVAASDALAGAMGGGEAESPPTETSPGEGGPAPASAGSDAADGDDGTTPVPPEPAPPGAVGVGDDPDAADGAAAGDPDTESNGGATTDGGPVSGAAAGGDSGADAGGADGPASDTGPAGGTDRATVRITRDVGAIFGVDEREYELASEDVVSLPVENADPLVQRDAAERID